MYACICAQVTDAQWKQALADQSGDFQAASCQTGAGTGCGGCRVFLAHLAHEHAVGLALHPGGIDVAS